MARMTVFQRRPHGSSLRRYLGSDEIILLITRQHPFALVRAALDCLALLAPLLLIAWGVAGTEVLRGIAGTWILRALFLAMVALVLLVAGRVLAWELERVVVTDEKVIHMSGVLERRIASTPLAKVSEFTVHQSLVGRVFDYGSLVVDVPGGREQALHGLAYLPDPAGLYRLISDQARRGRVHEGGGRLELDEAGLEDLDRRIRRDPWSPTLDGIQADHTLEIPRVRPRD